MSDGYRPYLVPRDQSAIDKLSKEELWEGVLWASKAIEDANEDYNTFLYALGERVIKEGAGVELCPACGDVIDSCQGHGEIGDPAGYEILQKHDAGDHSECAIVGCEP